MRTLRHAILAALLLPALGHAAYSIDHVSVNCSSSLTQTAGDALSYLCDGNLTLQGEGQIGTLTSDTGINLSATGNLTLDRLSLIAPAISMQTLSGDITVGADTRFFSMPGQLTTPPEVTLLTGSRPTVTRPPLIPIDTGAGVVVTFPGAFTVNAPTAVPEPSATLLAALGVAGVAWSRRKR